MEKMICHIENLPEKVWLHLADMLSQAEWDTLAQTSWTIHGILQQLSPAGYDYTTLEKEVSVTNIGADYEKVWPLGRNHLLLQSAGRNVAIYRINTQSVVASTLSIEAPITAILSFSPAQLILGTKNGGIYSWQLNAAIAREPIKLVTNSDAKAPILTVAKLSEQQFISTCANKTLRIFNVSDGKCVHEQRFQTRIVAVKVTDENSLTLLSTDLYTFFIQTYLISSNQTTLLKSFRSNGIINNMPILHAVIYSNDKVAVFRAASSSKSLNNIWVEGDEKTPLLHLAPTDNTKESIATISSRGNRACFFYPKERALWHAQYKKSNEKSRCLNESSTTEKTNLSL